MVTGLAFQRRDDSLQALIQDYFTESATDESGSDDGEEGGRDQEFSANFHIARFSCSLRQM